MSSIHLPSASGFDRQCFSRGLQETSPHIALAGPVNCCNDSHCFHGDPMKFTRKRPRSSQHRNKHLARKSRGGEGPYRPTCSTLAVFAKHRRRQDSKDNRVHVPHTQSPGVKEYEKPARLANNDKYPHFFWHSVADSPLPRFAALHY